MEETQVAKELYGFARALVAEITYRCEHWREDAVQSLVLEGLKTYRETGDVGLAKNRITSRQKNLLRDSALERRHEPKPEHLSISTAASQRDEPIETVIVRDFLGRLPGRRRQIVELRMAGLTAPEIANQCGVSLSTIERELRQARKDYLCKV